VGGAVPVPGVPSQAVVFHPQRRPSPHSGISRQVTSGSQRVDVDRSQLVGRRLKEVPVVVHLLELSPVGGRPASGREQRRFKRFAEVGEGLTSHGRSHPGFSRLRTSGSKGAGSCRPSTLSRMSPPHAGHWRGNFSPTRVISLAQAIRDVSWERGFCFALDFCFLPGPRSKIDLHLTRPRLLPDRARIAGRHPAEEVSRGLGSGLRRPGVTRAGHARRLAHSADAPTPGVPHHDADSVWRKLF